MQSSNFIYKLFFMPVGVIWFYEHSTLHILIILGLDSLSFPNCQVAYTSFQSPSPWSPPFLILFLPFPKHWCTHPLVFLKHFCNDSTTCVYNDHFLWNTRSIIFLYANKACAIDELNRTDSVATLDDWLVDHGPFFNNSFALKKMHN